MADHSGQVGFFVAAELEQAARRHAQKKALSAREGELTFGALVAQVSSLAGHLRREGVAESDRVGVLLPNSLAIPLSYYATQKIGATTVILDARLRGKELQRVLRNADLKLLITHARLMAELREALAAFPELRRWLVQGEGDESFEKRLSGGPPLAAPVTRAPGDDAVIVYTSGTTGEPKGVVLSYLNLAQYPLVMSQMGVTEATTVRGCILPMSHIVGPIVCNDMADKGFTLVIFDQFNPVTLLEGIEKHRISVFECVPTLFQMLLGVPDLAKHDTRSLKIAAMMGTTVPLSLLSAFKRAQPHVKVIQGYGLTETSPLITLVEPEQAEAKMGSIGRAVPNVEIKIVNERGQQAQPGEPGEIITRGPHVMKGYFRLPAATAERIRDGWLYTGDIGRCDSDGYYYHLGRKDDMIITGGLNVYPAEIENALYEHPKVQEAVAFAIPDPKRGNVIGAAIVPKPGQAPSEKELLSFLRANLANFKVPQKIAIRESFPRTSSGKIIKDPAALLGE
ncbi:MAG TPA: AMP-binding protein [Candidatus Acidoferrales bacterium]|nr:AMP-binding protein [Candidatus Acidoferrales bacterium]